VYSHPPPAGPISVGEKIVVHPYAGKTVPLWLAVVYLSSNLTLNGLNYYWFSRMIQTVSARFTTPKEEKAAKVRIEGSKVDLATAAEIAGKEARRRMPAGKN
jgi:hypothetical protein